MPQVWLYTLASSSDPDHVSCVVPWRVDDDLIFFGPCKKRIRRRLRKMYLAEGVVHREISDDIYIVGFNGSNPECLRKVVWAGKVSNVMTFAEAFRRLSGGRFKDLREDDISPLHVMPIIADSGLVGYEHRSQEHAKNDDWVTDLASDRANVKQIGRRIVLVAGMTPWVAFDNDCCMLLQNRFFATGEGIALDDAAVRMFREAQPGKAGVEGYAVFGTAPGGSVNGLRGSFLTMEGELAGRFVAWLDARTRLAVAQADGNTSQRGTRPCRFTSSPARPSNRRIC